MQICRTIDESSTSCCDITSAPGCFAKDYRFTGDSNAANAARVQIQHFLLHLEAHLIAKYGEAGAAIRVYMIFDACGPGRNIDPQILFKEDSEGDAWAEAISHLIF